MKNLNKRLIIDLKEVSILVFFQKKYVFKSSEVYLKRQLFRG
jgi:hypothetical protein